MGESWQRAIRQHIARELAGRLRAADQDPRQAADRVASFWREDYYAWLFPLRFGRKEGIDGLIDGIALFEPAAEGINLEPLAGRRLRRGFLDGEGLPPILPLDDEGHELLADHVLATTAVMNLLLRSEIHDSALFHQIRLGTLLHLLQEEEGLAEVLQQGFPAAWQVACSLTDLHRGERATITLPSGVDRERLVGLHEGGESLRDEDRVAVVIGAVQRIKQYVFETPGLNEIRGGSTLLDELIRHFGGVVSEELGPEVVLQAAASTLTFLAPSDQGEAWTDRLREGFFRRTGTAFIAVGTVTVEAKRIGEAFHQVMGLAHRKLEEDRYAAELPVWETLPFEERCWICRSRPAEGWYGAPTGRPEVACRVCMTKRSWGREERAAKVQEVLEWLRLTTPTPLGVKGEKKEEYVAGELGQLIPGDVRRDLLAVIYGDGNNFGGVIQRLSSLPLALQWTHRVEKTTQAAGALSLARATQEGAKIRGWEPGRTPALDKVPFQVLALGGDDLILLTWGALGLRVCERFLALTDLEFQRGNGEALTDTPLSFSLGCLLCDVKAPVRRTVEFAEEELLKWAKRAARHRQAQAGAQTEGTVAFLLTMSADQIPSDLSRYLKQMFWGNQEDSGRYPLCLTLRPLTARELRFLLDKAERLRERHSGRLHRIVEVFVHSSPLAAFLHYVYQKAREQTRPREEQLCALLEEGEWREVFGDVTPSPQPLPTLRLPQRTPLGEPDRGEGEVLFSPLWDLLEMIKAME